MVFVVTNIAMKITFDPSKNSANIVDRGLSFDMVADIDWNEAVHVISFRKANTREVKEHDNQ